MSAYVTNSTRFLAITISLMIAFSALVLRPVPVAYAASLLGNRYDKTSDARVSQLATHQVGFTITDNITPIGSIEIEFCSNDPIPGTACTAPAGFNLNGPVLSNQSGETGFSVDSSSTANRVVLTRAAVIPTVSAVEYEFDGVTNPSSLGTYYIRLRTFGSIDATGSPIEEGGIALSTTSALTVSAEVPPFIRFCAGVTIVSFDCSTANSFLIDLGEFSTSQPKIASSELVAATNAEFGYTVSISGTTLVSGTNSIPALASQSPSVPGTGQFGINLRSNTNPNIGAEPSGPGTANITAAYNLPNLFRFQNGDAIITSATSNDNRKFTVSYIANINASQAAGYYATTISYICLANF